MPDRPQFSLSQVGCFGLIEEQSSFFRKIQGGILCTLEKKYRRCVLYNRGREGLPRSRVAPAKGETATPAQLHVSSGSIERQRSKATVRRFAVVCVTAAVAHLLRTAVAWSVSASALSGGVGQNHLLIATCCSLLSSNSKPELTSPSVFMSLWPYSSSQTDRLTNAEARDTDAHWTRG